MSESTQVTELLDALEDMCDQHCSTTPPSKIDSKALGANAQALRLLEKYGRFEIETECERRIIGRWTEQPAKKPEREHGPTYCGVGMSLMLDRLREQYGEVMLSSEAEDEWVCAVSGNLRSHGVSPFSALLYAYGEIHHLYAEGDAEARRGFAELRDQAGGY